MKYPVYVLRREGVRSFVDKIVYFATEIKAEAFIDGFKRGACYVQRGWKVQA